jgi:hypothetical protein
MIREMSPIEIAAMDVAHDPEVFLTTPRYDDLPENDFHPVKWIANIILGLLLWGLFFWVVL